MASGPNDNNINNLTDVVTSSEPRIPAPTKTRRHHTTISSFSSATKNIPDEESLAVRIYRADLRALFNSGLPLSSAWSRRRFFRFRKRVYVEAVSRDISETTLYAPLPHVEDISGGVVPTEFVMIDPQKHQDTIVRKGDAFNISFVGFSATPQDSGINNDNEILMYSLVGDEDEHGLCTDGVDMPQHSASARALSQFLPSSPRTADAPLQDPAPLPNQCPIDGSEPPSNNTLSIINVVPNAPTGIMPSSLDYVYIHYDPVVDGHDTGSLPDTYITIPAGKSLYLQSEGGLRAPKSTSLRVRFSVMEIDKVTDVQARSVSSLDSVGSYVGAAAIAVPYVDLLTNTFSIASAVAKQGLKNYSKPDHVLSTDYRFLISPEETENPQGSETESSAQHNKGRKEACGDYLRYGYYFFLDKPIEAKLYAQTGSSSQRVPLYMKRKDPVSNGERMLFPLTGISYMVVRVSRGCSPDKSSLHMSRVRNEHRTRLENILHMCKAMEMLSMNEKKKRRNGRGNIINNL